MDHCTISYQKNDMELFKGQLTSQNYKDRLVVLRKKYNKKIECRRKKIGFEFNNLQKQNTKLKNRIGTLERLLQDEIMARIEAENTTQCLQEDLKLKQQMYQKLVIKIRSRNSHEERPKQWLGDTDNKPVKRNKKISKHIMAEEQRSAASSAVTDRYQWRSNNDSMECEQPLTTLQFIKNSLEDRINHFEKLFETESIGYLRQIRELDQLLNQLSDEMITQLRENRDLIDLRLRLNMKFETYRNILKLEESRLNRTLPEAQASVVEAAKRRRTLLDQTRESLDTLNISNNNGDIGIVKMNAGGKFIQLQNKSFKTISLSGWSLLHRAGEQETIFKFPSGTKIKPEAKVTVWSCDAAHNHSSPGHIVMAQQMWFFGDSMHTAVVNKEGNKVSTVQCQRMKRPTLLHKYCRLM